MANWYKKSFWRNLVDMHIPDWNPEFMTRFSPSVYAGMMEKAEVDASELYAGNCLGICFWPTKAGHMHAGLKGADIVGPTVAEIARKGVTQVIYFNIWSRWAHDTHPEWRMLSVDGRSTIDYGNGEYGRYGVCCMNAPGFAEYVRAQVSDLCGAYPMAGLWVDMIGWNGTICYCPNCRKRFLDEAGLEIPTVVDWRDPKWVLFQRKREAWYAEFAGMVRSAALSARPGISVTQQCASWQGGWVSGVSPAFLAQSDYLAGDFYGDALEYSVICKFISNVSSDRPIEFMTSRCVSLEDHTTIKSEGELRASACAAFAHNAAFTFIDAIDPAGTVNPALYEMMGRLHREVSPFERAASAAVAAGAKIRRDVSVYFNFESMIDPGLNGIHVLKASPNVFAGGGMIQKMKNIGEALIGARLPYDMICPKALPEAAGDSQAILLPSVYMLDAGEIGILRKFVEGGGALVVTGKTGCLDKGGGAAGETLRELEDMAGVRFEGETDEDVVYFAPADGSGEYGQIFEGAGYSKKYPMAVNSRGSLASACAGTEVLATLTLPYSGTKEIYRFGSAISNPPGRATGYPAVTLKKLGKGRVLYIAAPLENEKNSPQQAVFAALVKSVMARAPSVEVKGPPWLEALVYDCAGNGSGCGADGSGRIICSLLPVLPQRVEAAARGVAVTIKTGGAAATRVTDVADGCDLPFTQTADGVSIAVGEVSGFKMLAIDIGHMQT